MTLKILHLFNYTRLIEFLFRAPPFSFIFLIHSIRNNDVTITMVKSNSLRSIIKDETRTESENDVEIPQKKSKKQLALFLNKHTESAT